MRALLVAEGKHELGGALETLITRLSRAAIEIDCDRLARRDLHAFHGRGKGYFKRAVGWMREAAKRQYDALILVVDEDGHAARVRELDEAQRCELVSIARALGIAIRTFDAWMLADEAALSRVLGITVPTQPSPELQRRPKEACRRLRCLSRKAMSQTEFYAELSREADLSMLASRCPRGFAIFADRVRGLGAKVHD